MTMKVFNNIEIIMIDSEIYYNYNGILYTKEQFEDTYFPKIDTSSKPQEEIDLFDVEGNIRVKLQVNDYVKFDFLNDYDQNICGEGTIVYTEYDENDDRMLDYYKVKTSSDPYETIAIYGRDIDKAWR